MQLMIDIETLDTAETSVVLSIGCALWDHEGVYGSQQWLLHEQPGRTMSYSTVLWWLGQSKEAQDNLSSAARMGPKEVCNILLGMMGTVEGVWGNGADFDNRILANLFSDYGLRWPYKLNHCFRTLKSLVKVEEPKTFLKHSAVADAGWQAESASKIYKKMGWVG